MTDIIEPIITFLGFLLGLCLLMFVHELGHFLPARWFGMKVEKFYIFLDWPFKIFSFKHKETEYGLGVLPILAYVKIAGMVDESMDDKFAAKPPQPWEFRSKPAWQRIIVMFGGVFMNMLLGVFIFSMLFFAYGEKKEPIREVNRLGGIYVPPHSACQKLGFATGDKIIALNGKPVTYFSEINNISLLLEDETEFTIIRNGQQKKIKVPSTFLNEFTAHLPKEPVLFYRLIPAKIDSVEPGGIGAKIGLQKGDQILKINDKTIASFNELRTFIQQRNVLELKVKRKGKEVWAYTQVDSNFQSGFTLDSFLVVHIQNKKLVSNLKEGDTLLMVHNIRLQKLVDFENFWKDFYADSIQLTILRKNDTLVLPAFWHKPGQFLRIYPRDELKVDHIQYSFWTSFIPGTREAFSIVGDNLKGLKKIFSGEADPQKNLSGPVKIYDMYSKSVKSGGLRAHWNMLAVLSMILAFMNLLPILPILDGAHICFLILEWIRGKPLSTKVQLAIMNIGFIMFVILTVFILFNDIMNL
ncbi:MAG: site-2 protease family protein [Bacteroidia bacterium]|nr:site-2 protease family protein [Bacteroidia bacterium]MDW8157341.1 site-2 protease family protein [Bacteroidia bacterium]